MIEFLAYITTLVCVGVITAVAYIGYEVRKLDRISHD